MSRAPGIALLVLLACGCNLEQERARRALESEDPIQRVEALDRLAEAGDPDVRPLVVPLLRDPSARVRKKAVAALGLLGVEPHLRQVIGRLNDGDLEVRLTTVRVLGDSELKAARPALLLALQDPSMVVRRAAALALEALGMSRPRQIRELAREELEAQVKRLHHPDDQMRASAAHRVGLGGRQEGLPPLLRLLSHRSPLVVEAAAQAVGRIGGAQALARLVGLTRGSAALERRAAALGLAEMAASSPGATRQLEKLLQDPVPAVQRAAAQGLARSGARLQRQAMERACALVASPRVSLARAAARLLRQSGQGECAAVAELMRRARGGDAATLEVLSELEGEAVAGALLALARQGYGAYRHGAVKWIAPDRWKDLGESGEGEPKKAPAGKGAPGETPKQALARLLARYPERAREQPDDPLLPPEVSSGLVVRMIRALAGRPGTDAWLARVATEAPLAVRTAALRTLGRGAGETPSAAQAVRMGLGSSRASVRAAALEACGRLGEAALQPAVAALKHGDFDVRAAAARCLGALGRPGAVKPLLDALEREHAVPTIRALARIGDHAATRPLLDMLREDHAATRRDERVVVVEALGRLADPGAAAALERELSHPAWQVRRAAAVALQGMPGAPSAGALAICRNDYYATVRRACRKERGAATRPASLPALHPR